MLQCKLIKKNAAQVYAVKALTWQHFETAFGEQVTKMDPSQNKHQETFESVSEMKYIQRFFLFSLETCESVNKGN